MKDLLVFFFIFSWKTDQRSIEKVWKTWSDRRIDRNRVLGTTFLAKSRFFCDFGLPGRSLGKALWRILAGKIWGGKNDEKKVGKPVASAGDAYPGQDPPAGFLKHDSARLRSPGGRGARGLFALRVTRRGHLEVGSFEALSLWGFGQPRNKNKNTKAHKTRTHQEIGRLHQI